MSDIIEQSIETIDTKELSDILSVVTGDAFGIGHILYERIKNSQYSVLKFQWLLEKGYMIDSSETQEIEAHFDESQLDLLVKQCEGRVSKLLNKLIAEKLPSNAFYMKLWEYISDGIYFKDMDEQIYAFMSIFMDRRLPYFEIGRTLTMESAEYAQQIENLQDEIKKIQHICAIELSQKTERASLILDILDAHADSNEKVVLLANALVFMRQLSIPPDFFLVDDEMQQD
ncbi:hypothetical protein RFF05_14315 [Bengtsoniella intestinalis]|uniref:hypothetical protein n=1 Tax=Bengtsoniella intestinalis TaxID=3073143 RepID=UPI00391F7F49